MKKIVGLVVITLLISSFTVIGMSIETIEKIDTDTMGSPSIGKITSSPYVGRLRVYVVEPRSRWDNYDRDPYYFGFLDFAFNNIISIEYLDTYENTIIWNGSEAGYGNVRETNIMVIAVVFNPEQHQGYAYPPSQHPFDAYYVDATAAAQPGETGYNMVTENFTHTVFGEEATAPWCPHCPDMAGKLYALYESGEYPFYFVALVSDVQNQVAENRLFQEFNIYGYPTSFLDGGYKVLIGSGISESTYINRIKQCGRRAVCNLNLSVSVEWMGDGVLKIGISITDNNAPPNAPSISGPLEGTVGTEYNYTFVTTEPDGDDVYYYIDWGDNTSSGWLGSFTSGEEVIVNHIWDEQGMYNITAKAKDSYGCESNWSDPLGVTMPKPKVINLMLLQFLEGLLERFPLLARLLYQES